MPGEPGEPIGGAEPDEQQTDRRVGAGLGHLDQVLLAGQSMPVPQQHHDLHVAQRRKRGRLPGRGHRRRRPELLDDPELTFEHQISSGPAQASAEDVVVDRTFDDAVGHAIDALPEQFRTVVLLVDATGLSYLEAAELLGVPEGTVTSRLHRARKRVRDELAAADLAPRRRRL